MNPRKFLVAGALSMGIGQASRPPVDTSRVSGNVIVSKTMGQLAGVQGLEKVVETGEEGAMASMAAPAPRP